jgi:hypothetical protein
LVAALAFSHVYALTASESDAALAFVQARCPAMRPLLRSPARFFPATQIGLWTPAFRSNPDFGCVYLVQAQSSRGRPIWAAPLGSRVRGPVWAPDGRSFIVGVHSGGAFHAYRIDRSGKLQATYAARDFAFLRDGRLVLLAQRRLELETRAGRFVRLASEPQLERVAGFKPTFYGSLSDVRGFGAGGVVVQWWGRPAGNVLLFVAADGAIRRATPRWTTPGTYMPGPASWSPSGRSLLIPWQQPPRGSADGDHLHCLGLWERRRGYRTSFCKNPHFDTIVWAADGSQALLEDGRIVNRSGQRIGRAERVGSAFAARWTSAASG